MSVSRGGIDSRTSRLLRRSVRKICSGGADGCSALAFDPPGCGHSVACPADQSVSAHDAQPSPSSSLLGGTRAVPSRVIRGPCTTDQQTDSFPGTLNLGCMPPSEPPQDHRSEQSAPLGACGATIPPDITRPPADTAPADTAPADTLIPDAQQFRQLLDTVSGPELPRASRRSAPRDEVMTYRIPG